MRDVRAIALGLALTGATSALAEPIFISRQYSRCVNCHYSPTGGGLLTPYGRSLSRQELSTMGRSGSSQQAGKEEAFLYGALGSALGPVQLGINLRPAHLNFNFDGTSSNRDLFMNADLLAAYRVKDWTFYAEIGRQPRSDGAKIDSYEYWVAHRPEKGIGFRVGRFLPAYGVRLADHTAFTRAGLGLRLLRPALRARAQPHQRPRSATALGGTGPRGFDHRRRRPPRLHGHRPLPARPQPQDRPRRLRRSTATNRRSNPGPGAEASPSASPRPLGWPCGRRAISASRRVRTAPPPTPS